MKKPNPKYTAPDFRPRQWRLTPFQQWMTLILMLTTPFLVVALAVYCARS